jgi:hypothetical protein
MKEKGTLPRNAFDIPCGGLPSVVELTSFIHSSSPINRDIIAFLRRWYQQITHHREVTLYHLPNPQEQVDYSPIMIHYLLHDISEKQCKQQLFVVEQKRSRGLEERQIMDSFLLLCEEYFRKLVGGFITIELFISEIHEIGEYTKKEIQRLDIKYAHKGFIRSDQLLM